LRKVFFNGNHGKLLLGFGTILTIYTNIFCSKPFLYCSVKSICWAKGIPGVLRIVLIRLVAAHLNHAIAQSSQRYQSDAADNLELPTDKDEGEDATTIY
jgi:hypothetical protein